MMKENKLSRGWLVLFLAWIVATVATLGSLFFSDIMMFPPCNTCWYQRIVMYPLVIIFLVGMMPFDRSVLRYSAPFVVIGWVLALYHNLIQYGVISQSATPCVSGIPCSVKYIEIFGFVTIPMLSLVAFTLIAILLYMGIYKNPDTKYDKKERLV